MENYQPVQFTGVVPQLQVPSFVRPFEESQKRLAMGEQQEMAALDQDQRTQLANLKSSFVDQTDLMENLAKLSSTLAEQVDKTRQQEKKNQYDDTFFKFYNMPQEELDAAAKAQADAEAQINKEGNKTAATVKSVVDKKPEVSGSLQQAMSLSGTNRIAALNALAAARLDQYPGYLQDYIAARKPKTPSEYAAAQTEAMLSWGQQTGMNQANGGFLSLHVTPKLKRYNASDSEQWTKGYNIQKGQDGRIMADNALATGAIDFKGYFDRYTSTVGSDGRTLVSNAQTLQAITNLAKDGTLTPGRLVQLGEGTHPTTKKKWSEHPQFAQWMSSARAYKLNQRKQDRSIQSLEITDRFNVAERDNVSLESLAATLRAEGYPEDLIQSGLTTARAGAVEKETVRIGNDTARRWLDNNPGKKLPVEIWRDLPYETRRTFQSDLAPDTTGETTEEAVRGSDEFKALDKDVDNMITAVDPTIDLENDLTGQSGPANQAAFELQIKNWVAKRASQLMLGTDKPMDYNTAIEQAKQEWVEANRQLVEKKGIEAFIKDGRFVPTMGTVGVDNKLRQTAGKVATAIEGATLTNLKDSLFDSDYEYRADGAYSERVKILARKFGLRPIDIVNRARTNKGMQPVQVAQPDAAIQPTDRARLNSITNPSTQSLLRAQINSGQTLTGTPQQRTVALGRHLLSLGYGGIWQNEYFNYDKGYVPEGGQRVMQRSYPSAHNDKAGGRALDFGLQANGEAKLDQLAAYLKKNKARFGIRSILWRTSGHYDHLHVELN